MMHIFKYIFDALHFSVGRLKMLKAIFEQKWVFAYKIILDCSIFNPWVIFNPWELSRVVVKALVLLAYEHRKLNHIVLFLLENKCVYLMTLYIKRTSLWYEQSGSTSSLHPNLLLVMLVCLWLCSCRVLFPNVSLVQIFFLLQPHLFDDNRLVDSPTFCPSICFLIACPSSNTCVTILRVWRM